MKLVYKAIDKCRLALIKIEKKYLPDNGDGLHGAMKQEKEKLQDRYKAYEEFYNAILNAMEP